jgi:hypothetical protein
MKEEWRRARPAEFANCSRSLSGFQPIILDLVKVHNPELREIQFCKHRRHVIVDTQNVQYEIAFTRSFQRAIKRDALWQIKPIEKRSEYHHSNDFCCWLLQGR